MLAGMRRSSERASKEFNEGFDMCGLCAFSFSATLSKSLGDAATVQYHFELRLAGVEPRGDSLSTQSRSVKVVSTRLPSVRTIII